MANRQILRRDHKENNSKPALLSLADVRKKEERNTSANCSNNGIVGRNKPFLERSSGFALNAVSRGEPELHASRFVPAYYKRLGLLQTAE